VINTFVYLLQYPKIPL